MKRSLILLFICTLGWSASWAATDGAVSNQYQYDCSIANSNPQTMIEKVKDTLDRYKIFKQDDINVVLVNLKKYCCLKKYLPKCGEEQPKGPESPYLIDHLIDIGFRKLDGQNNISGTTDEQGKTRRQEIDKIAEDPKGKDPGQILSKFNEYWDVKGNADNKIARKYMLVCDEANELRMNFLQVQYDANIDAGYDGCKNIATKRINDEIRYVKALMVNKGIKYIADALNNYMQDYFLKDRFQRVMERLKEVVGDFDHWVQKVNGAENCTK